MKSEKTAIVLVTTVHDVDGPGLDRDLVEDFQFGYIAMSNYDNRGNRAAQVEQSVKFYGASCFAKMSPGKKRQAKIDHGRIQCVYRLIQLYAEGFAGVKLPGMTDQDLGKVGIDAPVADLIGVRQSIAGDFSADAHVIEPLPECSKTGLDVPEALPIG